MRANLHDRLQEYFRDHEAELIELHRELVRIPSVNLADGSAAGEDRVADCLAAWLAREAIPTRALAPQPGRVSLLAEWPAQPALGGPTLLWMSHTDVVSVGDAAAWTHPPFSAALVDGRIWGRGANDCKMLTACQAFALACLKRLGLPARGRVRMIAGADEEAGGRLGFGWLAHEHPDLLRADLAICEGGGAGLGLLEGDRPLISVGCGEKGRYDVTFTCRGPGGHAATPWGRVNPLDRLGELLGRIRAWQPDAVPASPIFACLGPLVGLPEGITADNLDLALSRIDAQAPALGRSLRAQSRMTLTPTVLHGGDGPNVIPTEARLTCDARLLPGRTREELEAVVRGLLDGLPGADAIDVTIQENAPPSRCDLPEPLLRMFERAAERAIGSPVHAVPTWCSGATDAHWVRALGTPVYGFQFIHPAADASRLGIHCIDESIEAAMLLPCALSLAHFALEDLIA
jgi:acetylornithine deacetylase/succinyl-diaminopimelate desuccinylase-like protein